MSDHKNLSDTELDGLLGAARSDATEAGADLLARVLGDADAVQSTMHVIQPSRQKRRMLPQLVALLGGWPAMAGLVSAGTPALAAMDTAQHTLRNTVMRDAIGGAVERVRSGAPMSAALKETGVFPPLVTQMVMGGEASGDMGQMFSKSADYLEDEFNAQTTVFLTLLEPAIIIMLAGVVLLVVAAIFLPILQLNTLAY